MLKNAPAYRQAGIDFVPLILPRVEHGAGLLQRTSKYASLLRIPPACAKPRAARSRFGEGRGASYLGIFLSILNKKTFSATS
jgi:hypothetical protein